MNNSSKPSSYRSDDVSIAPPPPIIRRSMSSFSSTDISKHYALNNQILTAFDSTYNDHKLYQVAYAIGMQFVEMALLEIPKHGYYSSVRHGRERQENAKDALRVTLALQQLLINENEVFWTDKQEKETQIEKVRQLVKVAVAENNQSTKASSATLSTTASSTTTTGSASTTILDPREAKRPGQQAFARMPSNFCGEWTAYADLINATLCPQTNTLPSTSLQSPSKQRVKGDLIDSCPSPSAEAFATFERPWNATPNLQISPSFASSSCTPDNSSHVLTEPQLVRRRTSDLEFKKALWLSGLEVAPPQLHNYHIKNSLTDLDIMTLGVLYHEDFDTLRANSTIRVNRMTTYQGRLPETINGCTVIAPLLCIHHFHSSWDDEQCGSFDRGLPDETIVQVIDVVTPNILPQVRHSLGLTKDALIIPSDVHDYLIHNSWLSPEQFVAVCGGNILDAAHLDSFMQQLAKESDGVAKRWEGKKLAATLFFHEHVITINKLLRENGEVWYDWIDSLPSESTFRKMNEDDDPAYVPFAVRVRCCNEEALKVLIRWYACSRFSKENEQYIDMYAWDDREADFDPRVFQAFVWAEM